jgi:hypothetical protein
VVEEVCAVSNDIFPVQAGRESANTSAVPTKPKTKFIMKKFLLTFAFLACASTSLLAAEAKSYQVTGPVLEVTATTITVQNKDDEKWQIASDAATTGKVKVGDKVTIKYQMVAKEVEVKADKKADKK